MVFSNYLTRYPEDFAVATIDAAMIADLLVTTWSPLNPVHVVRLRLQLPVQPSKRGDLFNEHEDGF